MVGKTNKLLLKSLFGFTKISIHNSIITGQKNNMILLGVLYEYSSTDVADTEINHFKLE